MKRFFKGMTCMLLMFAIGISLAACGQTNDFIQSKMSTSLGEGEGAVAYSNTTSFGLDYKGDNMYKARGEANVMNQEQADAFWKGEVHAGENYVVLTIKFDAGTKLVYGFDREDANFNQPDGVKVKARENTTEVNDMLDLILRVKKDGEKTFKVVSSKEDKDAVTYTIDFSDITYKTAE